ncbi:hypothetical protein ACIPYS_21570 [Kitasatospora sp. NPDC089913]|uniref:hypothetical protein n=1 Tax=Kitasatospora sp. NPDC089913 TaxID=3364080 RepID=UPI00380838F7
MEQEVDAGAGGVLGAGGECGVRPVVGDVDAEVLPGSAAQVDQGGRAAVLGDGRVGGGEGEDVVACGPLRGCVGESGEGEGDLRKLALTGSS